MSCSYKTPKGTPSRLFDKIYQSNGLATAVHNHEMFNSPDFIEWYGDGVRTEDKEVIVRDGTVTNGEGKIRPLINKLPTISADKAEAQVTYLQDVFKSHGIDVEVESDPDALDIGYVIGVGDKKAKIKYNPGKVRQDSIFHEFGHIYVDLLGLYHSLVKEGIRKLKGTDLWNTLARLKPTLNEEQLAKEVLTTAIGMEASRRFDAKAKYRRNGKNKFLDAIDDFIYWVNRFFRAVGDKLGLDRDPAARLAYDLTSGKLRSSLTGKISTYKQKQEVLANVYDLQERTKRILVEGISGKFVLTDTGENYTLLNDKSVLLDRTTKAIERVLYKFDRDKLLGISASSKSTLLKKYNSIKEVAELWADKREEGTGIHGIAQVYIEGRNANQSRSSLKTKILDNLPKPEDPNGFDSDGIRYYSGMNRDQVANYVDTILDFIDKLYAEGYVLLPEFVIGNLTHLVAGTIDIIAIRKDGTIDIFDFKSKELVIAAGREHTQFDKFNTFDQTHPYLRGALADIPNTTGNKYAVQLSFYKSMLEDFGLDVNDLYIVPMVGEIEQRDGQYNYKNLKMFTNTSAINFNKRLGVFKVTDFTSRIDAIMNTKEDATDVIIEQEVYEKLSDNLRERVDNINNLSEWVKDVIADLHRSIKVGKDRIIDKSTYNFYKVNIEGLIDKLLVEDEFEAIASYTKYLNEELQRMHKILFTHLKTSANESTEVKRGYASMTWEDFKLMETENPGDFNKLLAFVVNARNFLDQVIYVQSLSAIVTDENKTQVEELAKLAKATESDISELQNHIDRINEELNIRYFEASGNPLIGKKEREAAINDFFAAQKDETFWQANFDSLGDTHHPFIANVRKVWERHKIAYEKEAKSRIFDLSKEIEDIDLTKFVDEAKAKFISEFNYTAYYKAVDKMYKEAKEKFGNDKDAYRKFVNRWFYENTEVKTKEEIKLMEQRMKKKLGTFTLEGEVTSEFNEWKRNQMFKYGENWVYRRDRAYYKPKANLYTDSRYEALSEKEKNALKYIKTLLFELVENNHESIIEDGYIPAVHSSNREDVDKLLSSIGWHDAHKDPNEELSDRSGDKIYTIMMKYISKLASAKIKLIPDGATPEVVEAIKKENKEERERAEAAHAAKVNTDLSKTLPIFIKEATKVNAKRKMEMELLRVYKDLMRNHKIVETRNGALITDLAKRLAGKGNTAKETSVQDSKIFAHFKGFLKMVFYEDFEKDEGNWTKVARVLQNYTSLKNMGLNFFAAINNTTYGHIMSSIEGAGGQFYANTDWRFGQKEYLGNMLSYFADDENSIDFASKASAFIKEFPIMMDFKELGVSEEDSKYNSASLRGSAYLYSSLYMLQHASEHFLQNALLFTMANSHRVVNGKIISYQEYLDNYAGIEIIDPYATNKELEKLKIAKNKEVKKKSKEEFKKHPTVYEAYDFTETKLSRGVLKLKEGIEVSATELQDFQIRVLAVNQRTHGIYNREDAGTIQNIALGRLAMQFRKWMRPGFTKRYGTRAGETFYNERLRATDEGTYMTTWNFLRQPYLKWSENKKESKRSGEQITAMTAASKLLGDYGRFIANANLHWHSLSEEEKSRVIQHAYEFASFLLITLAASLYFGLSDDDEEELPTAYYMLAHQLDRSILELTTYTPFAVGFGKDKPWFGGGVFNEYTKLIKSPFAANDTLKKIFTTGIQLIMYPFLDEEDRLYQTGPYAGTSKALVNGKKLLPVYNQFFKLWNIDKTYRYYRLY